MISSYTSMDNTLYKITSMTKLKSLRENNSPSVSLSPFQTQRKFPYNKTINPYINFTSTIDLMKQSRLKKDSRILFSKSYYINLLKIKLKKKIKPNKFPPIKTFSPLKTSSSINHNIMQTLTTPNFLKNRHINAFSFENKNHNKNNNMQNKKIFNQNPQNLKIVYVNKLLSSKNINVEIDENDKIKDKIKIKNKIEDNKYNLNMSKMRFMNYHGFNRKAKDKDNKYNSNDKYSRGKYAGLNNKKIRQFFLKKKLNAVNGKMKFVKKNVEDTKSKINNLYMFLNRDIQNNLEEDYKRT